MKVKGSKKRQREKKKKDLTTDDGIIAPPVLPPITYVVYDAPNVFTAKDNRAYHRDQALKNSRYSHYVHTLTTGPEAAPTLDGSEPSTHKPFTPAPRRITPQTPRMSRLEKEAAKNARNTPNAVYISPTFLPQVVEADQALTAGISPVPDPLEPTILSQVVEAGDARGAAMPPVTPEPTPSPVEAVPPTQVPLTGAQITAANTFRNRLLSTARLSRYRKDLETELPISKAMALNLAARTSITNTTTSSRHGRLWERNLDALSYATRKLSTLKAIKDARILAIHVSVARRVSQTAPSVLRTSAVQELNSHLLFISEDRPTPFGSKKLLHHLRRTVPASLNLGEPGLSAKKPSRKRTQAPDSIRLSRAAMRQVKAATLNRDYLLKNQERLTATKDGPFMVPGSPPPVLAVPFVPPSWAAIMTGGYRHHRIRCKLRACHPYSRKEMRRANRRDKETRRANLLRKTPRSCAGFVPEVVETSDVRGVTLPPVTPEPTISPHEPDRPLSGSLHSVLAYSVLRFIPTSPCKEARRANRCKTPRSCAGGDPGSSCRHRSAGAHHSTPTRSSHAPSRPYHQNGGYGHGEGGDDHRGRPPPPPPPIYPRRSLPDLQIRCHFSDHAGQCENICRLHNGQFRHRVVRKHTTLTFCTANCMECFMRDERDTLISQPFPLHVRHAAGAKLRQYVQTLLEDRCPDGGGYAWPLRSLLDRTVRTTASMDLQHISTRAVYTRFLYDVAIDAVSFQVDEDNRFNVASAGLLCWAESVENRHLFRIVQLDANSDFHCDRWGLELNGKSPAKGTSAPAGRVQGERSNGKRRKDFPNSSVRPSPTFSSASSLTPGPRGPIADVNGHRWGEESFNFVQPPPIRVSKPAWHFPGTHPNLIISRRVPTLLRSQKKWRSVSELLAHFLDYTQPEECNGLVTYLRSISRVGYIHPDRVDALDHATCNGFIAWANLAINQRCIATLGIPASEAPVSLLIDQHPGDHYFLS